MKRAIEQGGCLLFFVYASGAVFCSFLCFLKIFTFPFDAERASFLISFTLSYNFFFSLRRAQAARGPLLFCSCRKVGKRQAQGSFTPLADPRTKVGCWTPPFGNPQVLASAVVLAELLAACAAGASVPLGKAASACALATIAAPPPLRGGGCAPWPPAFPKGKSPPIMRASAWDRVRNGFCGNAPANLPEAPAAQAARSSVTFLARLCRRHSSATAGGFQRGNPFGLLFCLLFCRSRKVGAWRGLSASKGKSKILRKHKRDHKRRLHKCRFSAIIKGKRAIGHNVTASELLKGAKSPAYPVPPG